MRSNPLSILFAFISQFKLQFVGLLFCLVGSGVLSAEAQQGLPYNTIPNGIVLKLAPNTSRSNSASYLRLQFITGKIIRVSARPDANFPDTNTLMILDRALENVNYKVTLSKDQNTVLLHTDQLQVEVTLATGRLTFKDSKGGTLLQETNGSSRKFSPVDIGLPNYYSIEQTFDNIQGSALYGLGGNQLGWTNLKGKDLEMVQYNSNVFVPFLVSSGHFGLLWNNSSVTRFGHPEAFQSLEQLQLFDRNQKPGGLTATYLTDSRHSDKPVLRTEKNIGYEFAKDTAQLPEGFKMNTNALVTWEGYLQTKDAGVQQFALKFGGYIKIWIDGKLLTDWWRQSWNPAEKRFGFPMDAGKKYKLKVEWRPDGTASFASLKSKATLLDQNEQIRFQSEAASGIDYYFVTGGDVDSLISGYRYLTGKAPIMPKWAYGFWQSKEHYNSQEEILKTAAQFREKHIPIDNIVQDWYYWKEDQWGSQEFDTSRYPDPKAMIDSLHSNYNLHFMISVWPKFYEGTAPFKKFWDSGWLYRKNILDRQQDWMGHVSTFYDAFNPHAGKAFWDLVNHKIYTKGVDAWWLDATEPDIVDNITNDKRMRLMTPTYAGAPQINFNAYALANEAAFYNGQREASPDKRVFILTRSAFAGSQRYGAATWSGDIGSTWKEMKNQIATGISFCLAGIPYWSMDIGGFSVENRYHHPSAKDLAEWRELQTRWFQFGAFAPIFRSHGQAPAREMFNIAPANHPAYQSMLYYDQLRYRLMPYIYSLGAATYFDNYTLMRGLVMDFPSDSLARASTDEYMFGPGLLVCPVYTYEARSKEVYLPAATNWYDLYNGKSYTGGRHIQANAPYQRMPVFVRAGTILPVGPVKEFTGQKQPGAGVDTITLFVYGGQDGKFTLYNDQGTNNDYEKGDYQKINLSYDDQNAKLIISAVEGKYSSDFKPRVFIVRWIRQNNNDKSKNGEGIDTDSGDVQEVNYNGQPVTVTLSLR